MRKPRVIIIEDEFFAASHLSDSIESLGFEVVEIYYSGEDFLESTNWEFEVALIDVFLSDELNGLQIAEKMKEVGKEFVFITASQDEKTMMAALDLKPVAYINKPFKVNEVVEALEKVSLQ